LLCSSLHGSFHLAPAIVSGRQLFYFSVIGASE
jgi:hypothetical protein